MILFLFDLIKCSDIAFSEHCKQHARLKLNSLVAVAVILCIHKFLSYKWELAILYGYCQHINHVSRYFRRTWIINQVLFALSSFPTDHANVQHTGVLNGVMCKTLQKVDAYITCWTVICWFCLLLKILFPVLHCDTLPLICHWNLLLLSFI